ncbi:MAG: CbiX/SirB N-terminal domain-containing protein [Gemmatimonadota bacterium]|nr:MAG: CbiX/SirB N-terminal domain-containing protein [Gemmatimonadota bacterium]
MLILVAHGSPKPQWRAAVERLTASIQAEIGEGEVRLAYMECSPPSLMDVVSDAAKLGVTEIRVLPLFLANEGHVERNVRPLVDEARRTHQPIDIELLPALGHYRQFRKLIYDIAMGQAR